MKLTIWSAKRRGEIMTYQDLMNIIRDWFKIESGCTGLETEVKHVRFLDEMETNLRDDTLYLVRQSSRVNINDLSSQMLVLERFDLSVQNPSWTVIPARIIDDIYDFVRDLLIQETAARSQVLDLSMKALQGKNISVLMNQAAELMGNALIIADNEQKVLSYSTNFSIEDPLWLENIKSGHYSHDFMMKVRYSEDMKGWKSICGATRLIKLEGDKNEKLVSKL